MIVIDYQDRRPLYEQIVEKFKNLILKGVLEADSQMPPVRRLAMELSINPNTIQRAYAELERQGFIYPVKGRGNFVSANLNLVEEKKREYMAEMEVLLQKGIAIGISEEEMLRMVHTLYEAGSKGS